MSAVAKGGGAGGGNAGAGSPHFGSAEVRTSDVPSADGAVSASHTNVACKPGSSVGRAERESRSERGVAEQTAQAKAAARSLPGSQGAWIQLRALLKCSHLD